MRFVLRFSFFHFSLSDYTIEYSIIKIAEANIKCDGAEGMSGLLVVIAITLWLTQQINITCVDIAHCGLLEQGINLQHLLICWFCLQLLHLSSCCVKLSLQRRREHLCYH